MIINELPFKRWAIDNAQREELLAVFLPHYPIVWARYLEGHAGSERDVSKRKIELVGEATDSRGVQALIVSIDGSIQSPAGHLNHIIWSVSLKRVCDALDPSFLTHWEVLPNNLPIRLRLENIVAFTDTGMRDTPRSDMARLVNHRPIKSR